MEDYPFSVTFGKSPLTPTAETLTAFLTNMKYNVIDILSKRIYWKFWPTGARVWN
ncbi:hypothetical protein O53_2394 [Microcystis aeruginosa TAIHU98]|uniref:Uncharacterized protein n=1 Tax=Microcystis aeruginosa TAIHU98 TaxID=1134457 RepID=L7E4Q2_MICAE|nr:hypothetical protein O53_2394 [Microcystis aeruginosa TAIHU98]